MKVVRKEMLFCNSPKITSAIILALLEASASCILPTKGMPFCPMLLDTMFTVRKFILIMNISEIRMTGH
jgi:hypothetical protein